MSSDYQLAQLSSGVRLAYVEQGDPNGTPVVMLHGTSDSHHSFDLVRPLLPRAWRVIAVTERGHGDSDKPSDGYAMSDFAADVPALMDALEIERAVLVGHSMGTAITLQAASLFPERFAAIALIGAFADFKGNPGVTELAEAVDGFDDPVDPAFIREFQESTLANPIPQGFFDLAVAESRKLPARVWRGAVRGMRDFDPRAAAARCRAPAAIIWGDKDAFCPREDQLKLRDTLCSSRLFTLANVGHAVHWERPADTAALLRAFVAEIEDAASLASDDVAA